MHLMIGTPMFGGWACSEYIKAMLELKGAMVQHGHEMTSVFVGNESLIQRARNRIVHIFLASDASHLLFMDADQSFVPSDIIKMIKCDKDVIAAPVPMKGINWDMIRVGAENNHKNLENLTGIFNIRQLPGHLMMGSGIPFQVKYAGSGYMLIKREAFEKLSDKVNSYTDHGTDIKNFFSAEIVDSELLSEDFHFCHQFRKMGGSVWAYPGAKVEHFGSYAFKGDYVESWSLNSNTIKGMIVNG